MIAPEKSDIHIGSIVREMGSDDLALVIEKNPYLQVFYVGAVSKDGFDIEVGGSPREEIAEVIANVNLETVANAVTRLLNPSSGEYYHKTLAWLIANE